MAPLRSAAIPTTPVTTLLATASRRDSSTAAAAEWACCVLAANGNVAAPPTSVMNSRRFIGCSSPGKRRECNLASVARGYHGGLWRSMVLAPDVETYSCVVVAGLLLASGKGHQSNARVGCFMSTPQVQGDRQ